MTAEEFLPKSVAAADCSYGGKILKIAALEEFLVRFSLCKPDPAFMAKIAFIPFSIQPEEWLDATGGTGEILEKPVGTGPYVVESWNRGDSIIFKRFDDYWGAKAKNETLVFRWATEGAARLLELQSGTVDYITNVSPDDIETVKNDPNLQLLPFPSPNILYLAMTNTFEPFDDVKVRQAIAMGIDRQRIVDNFYPAGSEVASHFTPCSIPGGCEGESWYDFDPTAAKAMLADAGFPEGFKTAIYYRDVFRSYLPEPGLVAVEFQTQLKENLGIDADVVVMESGEFIDESTNGRLDGFYLLGWGADYPASHQLPRLSTSEHLIRSLAIHSPKSTNRLKKLHRSAIPLSLHRFTLKPTTPSRNLCRWYPSLMVRLTMQRLLPWTALTHRPLVRPTTHCWTPVRIPLSGCRTQNPSASTASDETDGESLAPCWQVLEPLFRYKPESGDVEPVLATSCEPNEDLTEWTCTLREGVKFHDGSTFDANDVIASWAAGIDASNPNHTGNTGVFDYYSYLWDGLMNADE